MAVVVCERGALAASSHRGLRSLRVYRSLQVGLQGRVTGDGCKGVVVGVGRLKKSTDSTTSSESVDVALLFPLPAEIDDDR